MTITREQLLARRNKLLLAEASKPERWWWLSFADEAGFRGGVVIRARGFVSAVELARARGLNPGGEVKGYELDDNAQYPPERFANRLLSKEEIEAEMGGAVKWPPTAGWEA